jgi:hypothetical protein
MTALFDFASLEPSIAAVQEPLARIAARTRLLANLFEEDVKKAGWVVLGPEDRMLPSHGRVIVMGVVLWNDLDRDILKEAAVLLRGAETVFVFNLDDVHSATQLQALLPAAPLPTTTPVAAVYENGTLKNVATGAEVRAFLKSA